MSGAWAWGTSRMWLATGVAVVVAALVVGASLYREKSTPIRIGVLHSLTGTMAASEKPLVDAVPRDVERGKAAGFADYLTKPMDLKKLYAIIDRLLITQDAEKDKP